MSDLKNGPELWKVILTKFPPEAIIAGGAVRDYLLGVEPKDIDVFVPSSDFIDNIEWKEEGFMYLGDARQKEYEALPMINIVMHGRLNDIPVDYIGVSLPVWGGKELVSTFDFGITRCWFKDGDIYDTDEAEADRIDKTVTVYLTDRMDRARERFSRFNEKMGNTFSLRLIYGDDS